MRLIDPAIRDWAEALLSARQTQDNTTERSNEMGWTRTTIPNTLEALEALPYGAELVSRHGHALVVEGERLYMEHGHESFTLPFAHRYVLDENATTLEVDLPEVIDATGCVVYVTGDTAGAAHLFRAGDEVVIEDDSEYLRDGMYDCRSTSRNEQWWVSSVDLALEPPPEGPVPLYPTDSTCVGDVKALDALPERSVVLCPHSERSWVRRGADWVTVLGGVNQKALAEAGDDVFYRSDLVVVLHYAQTQEV